MIRLHHVSHDFGSSAQTALCDLCLEIDNGEFVFITGHSGCGKTTLLRLLLRQLIPTEGVVEFSGVDLSQLSPGKVAKHRQKLGAIFQDYQLLDDLTVRENITLPMQIAKLPKKEMEKRIEELLELLKLQGLENKFPAQLSGGEAQRVGLARALAIAPKVIFADEPTGNLDDDNAQIIVSLLKNINQFGTTVIVATHDLTLLPMVENARHLVLENGRLISDSKIKQTDSRDDVVTEKKEEAVEKPSKNTKSKKTQTVKTKTASKTSEEGQNE